MKGLLKPLAITLGVCSPLANAQTYDLPLSQLNADEQAIINQQPAGLQLVLDSIQTLDNDTVDAITVLSSTNPDNVKRVESILSSSDWDHLFPQRNSAYTYLNFLKGIGKFPAFCGDYNDGRNADQICRKSLATMFAHFTQETGGHDASISLPQWRQGLYYLREVGWTEETSGGYGICDPGLWQGASYPCGTNADGSYKSYFGRGSKQLSYNYNYGPFSLAMFGNVEKLLNEPNLVADTWLNLASAVFFYLYPQPPKPSMLHVMDGTWQPNAHDIAGGLVPGFGVTTQIINGGVECGGSVEHRQSANRIEYYREFANYLDVPVPGDEVLGCAGMQRFDTNGNGALNIYWEEDWSWSPDTPNNVSYKCQLVSYQGPYSAFIEGDYRRCVEDKFDVRIVDGDQPPQLPVANAGADQNVTANGNVSIQLNGTQSTSSTSLSYIWQQNNSDVIAATIEQPNSAITNVQIPLISESTNFHFTLTVTDQASQTSNDEVVIFVSSQTNNGAPTATLSGPDQITVGQQSIVVSASVSDLEQDELSLSWNISGGITGQVSANNQSITFTAPNTAQTLQVSLQVTDSAGNTINAVKTIEVINSDSNCPTEWKSDAIYVENDTVLYNQLTWRAKWWTQGNIPGTEQWGPWEQIPQTHCTAAFKRDCRAINKDRNSTGRNELLNRFIHRASSRSS
ncbi:hypothetical protein EYS14_06390 [Alteromonadaceae bacterium M269]|nr:hypothetical protein EYS14_06390 [Alteromonadaceae bacterium M269]